MQRGSSNGSSSTTALATQQSNSAIQQVWVAEHTKHGAHLQLLLLLPQRPPAGATAPPGASSWLLWRPLPAAAWSGPCPAPPTPGLSSAAGSAAGPLPAWLLHTPQQPLPLLPSACPPACVHC
jgi:hypothetical protein